MTLDILKRDLEMYIGIKSKFDELYDLEDQMKSLKENIQDLKIELENYDEDFIEEMIYDLRIKIDKLLPLD